MVTSTKELMDQTDREVISSRPRNLLEAARFSPSEVTSFRVVQVISLTSLFLTAIGVFLPLVHFQWFGTIIDYLSIALFFQSSVISPTIGFPMAFVFMLSLPTVFLTGMLFHVTYRKKYLAFQAFMQAFLTFPTLFFLLIFETALRNKTRNFLDLGIIDADPSQFLGSTIGESPWLFLMAFLLTLLAIRLYNVAMRDKIEGYYMRLKAMLLFSSTTASGEYT